MFAFELTVVLFAVVNSRMIVSELANGTALESTVSHSTKLNTGASYPLMGLVPLFGEPTAEKIIDKALELGYRRIETYYSDTRLVGKVLKKWFSSGKLERENVFITAVNDKTADRVLQHFDRFFTNYSGLSYVDLYILHPREAEQNVTNNDETDPNVLTWKVMETLVRDGKAKALGVTYLDQTQIESIIKHAKILPAVAEHTINAYCQFKQSVNLYRSLNMAVSSLSALDTITHNYTSMYNFQEVTNEIGIIANNHNRTIEDILIRFLTQQNIAVSLEATSESELIAYLKTFDFNLSEEEMDDLKSLFPNDEDVVTKCCYDIC